MKIASEWKGVLMIIWLLLKHERATYANSPEWPLTKAGLVTHWPSVSCLLPIWISHLLSQEVNQRAVYFLHLVENVWDKKVVGHMSYHERCELKQFY